MKQHKWHKEIKAWADGAEIEVLDTDGVYRVVHKPNWGVSGVEFRIKPQPKEPQSSFPKGCRRPLASGQYWNICGETDYGSSPALCEECGGNLKLAGNIVKKPQYLYVYKNSLAELYFRDFDANCSFENYIGKIKLEDTK